MARTDDGGGVPIPKNNGSGTSTSNSTSKKEKEQKPFWKTDEFRQQHLNAEYGSAPKTPEFNVQSKGKVVAAPVPVTRYNKDDRQEAIQEARSNREKSQSTSKDVIRNQVKQEVYKYLNDNPGTYMTNVNEYVDQETEARYSATLKGGRKGRTTGPSRDQALRDDVLKEETAKIKGTDNFWNPQNADLFWNPQNYLFNKTATETVDERVRQRLKELKQPRYIMLEGADGKPEPFALDKLDERQELQDSLRTESPIQRNWTLFKYDMMNSISKVTRLIGNPAVWVKERATEEHPGEFGALAQLGLNSLILGIDSLRSLPYELAASEAKYKRLQAEADALKYTDPEAAAAVQQTANMWKRNWEIRDQKRIGIKLAEEAVKDSWRLLVNESAISAKNQASPLSEEFWNPRKYAEAIQAQRQKEAQAEIVASGYREQARAAFEAGNDDEALRLTMEAQKADRDTKFGDAYGAYTWEREPERYDKFLKNAALVELQKGAPLSVEEIRRLKEYHANAWTEGTGEFLFDPLNLIPGALMEELIKLPIKGARTVGKAAMKVKPVAKTVHTIASPVKWILRQSVASGGDKIERMTFGTFSKIIGAYDNSVDGARAIGQVADVVIDIQRNASTEVAARAAFEKARVKVPGLEQITFREFKTLVDAAEHVDPTQWAKLFENGLTVSREAVQKIMDNENLYAKMGNEAKTLLDSEMSHSHRALQEVAVAFKGAFLEPHRITKGSKILDDTVSGWVTKTLRELSGDQANELLRMSGMDEWAKWKSTTLGENTKGVLRASYQATEALLHAGSIVRDYWSKWVLTTPRWIANNMIDSTFRHVVYGGNAFQDLATLALSTQRMLADELGFVPLEFTQSLARADLDFTHNVTTKLLYEGWKPKWGPLSYMAEEYRRARNLPEYQAKAKVIQGSLEKLPKGKFRDAMGWVMDGLNIKTGAAVWHAIPGGIGDFNTAIEFTLRLRMFHQEYFRLLNKLEPKFAERGMEALSPGVKEIARQIWRDAEGNPRRISATVDKLLGKGGKKNPAWSLLVPANMDKLTKGMTPEDAHLFVTTVRSELDNFIQTTLRNGRDVTSKDIDTFFSKFEDEFQVEIQTRLAATNDIRNLDTSIDPTKKPTAPVNMTTGGSMPVNTSTSRGEAIQKATEKLSKGKTRQPTTDVVKHLTDAVSGYAEVQRVAGDGIRRVVKDGKTVIEVGDNVLKGKTSKMYAALHETLLDVFSHVDEDVVLRRGFKDADHFRESVKLFIKDPTEILARDERQFVAIVQEFTAHPQMKELIERTGGMKIKWEKDLDLYRENGVYNDVYGFLQKPTTIMEAAAQKLRPLPGHHVVASQDMSVATAELSRVSKQLPTALQEKIAMFNEHYQVYRQELKQFYAFTFPGPLTKSTDDALRHAGWDRFYEMGTEQFNREAAMKKELVRLLSENPGDAERLIDEALSDFGTYILKENGIEAVWDADRQMILEIRIKVQEAHRITTRVFTNEYDRGALHLRMFSKEVNQKLAENPMLKLRTDVKTKVTTQIQKYVREVFGTNNPEAATFAKVLEAHATRWSEVTGQPIEKYYERIGFQKFDGLSEGLSVADRTRVVKRGAIQRTEDGRFVFLGLGQSNMEALVRETGELMWDDLAEMARYNEDYAKDFNNLKAFLEGETGKKIKNDVLKQEHSNVLTDLFARYVKEGHSVHPKLTNSFRKMQDWIVTTYEEVNGTPIKDLVDDDLRRVLDRMFVEKKIDIMPGTNTRKAKIISKEAGIPFNSDEELLKEINLRINPDLVEYGNVDPRLLSPEQQQAYQQLQEQVAYLRQVQADTIASADDTLQGGMTIAGSPELEAAERALADFEASLPKKGPIYQGRMAKDLPVANDEGLIWASNAEHVAEQNANIIEETYIYRTPPETIRTMKGEIRRLEYDVENPMHISIDQTKWNRDAEREVIANARAQGYDSVIIHHPDSGQLEFVTWDASKVREVREPFKNLKDVPATLIEKVVGKKSKVLTEMEQGWEIWKMNRKLKGFPDDALKDAQTFKDYLVKRHGETDGELAIYYNRMQWEVEQWEDAMLTYHAGEDFLDKVFPKVPDTLVGDQMKVWIRNQAEIVSNYEVAQRALKEWRTYMVDNVSKGHNFSTLTKAQLKELADWAPQASAAKAELVDTLINGGNVAGEEIGGALAKVNKVMLDYQSRNVLDNFMKNFFPFWMFPSRSLPFWIETMATHPVLIANYDKLQRISRTQRYQSGAVTSRGVPLPSLDGYIKIPGTDMWINPIAPLSFRYALDVAKSKDDLLYASSSTEDNVEPSAWLAKEMIQSGQIYGFSPAPWITWLMKKAFSVPDEVIPQFALLPEIPLIPRWMVNDMISKTNKMTGLDLKGLADTLNPEAPWHDFLVQRRILEDALMKVRTGNLSEEQKLKLQKEITQAITERGENKLWLETYKAVTNQEAGNAWVSFFTGYAPKEFSEGAANRIAMSNQWNLTISALNNEFQAEVFKMDGDAETRWSRYLEQRNTTEGWIHRLYTDIGWVTDESGNTVREPEERAKYLALKVKQDENQQIYYQKMSDLQNEYTARLKALPVGADWDKVSKIYEWYAEERKSLDYLRTYERVYGSNKPAELIMKDIANDWFQEINSMKPRWDVEKGETYTQYQERVAEWQERLPNIAPLYMRAFLRRTDVVKTLDALKDDQMIDPAFFQNLVTETNTAGMETWQKSNDDVFDALNKAWKATYWDAYWDSVIGKEGYEVDLAERDFFSKHPTPPSALEMTQWINQYYGPGRFSPEEIAKWMGETPATDITTRQSAGKGEDFDTRQDIWKLLSWVGPGNRNQDVFKIAFANAGGDPDMLTVWYEEVGTGYSTQPERLKQLRDALQEAVDTLGLKAPDRAELVQYVEAQRENNIFKDMVKEKFGDAFFDYTDEDGLQQQGLLSYYNALPYEAKKEFRGSDMYTYIEEYYSLKDEFAEDHKTWADYYGSETTPTVGVDADGNSTLPISFQPNRGGGGGGKNKNKTKTGGGGKSVYSPTSYSRTPYFGINSRIGVSLPPSFYKMVGEKMAWEISEKFSNGRKISTVGQSFLRNVASRHPQYRDAINKILS